MDAKYFVVMRPQTNDRHAVHKEGCPFLTDDKKRIYLGRFSSVPEAVKASQQYFIETECCIFCSKDIKIFKDNPVLFNMTKEDMLTTELKIPASLHQSLICCVN